MKWTIFCYDNINVAQQSTIIYKKCYKFCRPDLVDWKKVERRQVRERIDTAFHIMEKEYGVTRLLDPEGKMIK